MTFARLRVALVVGLGLIAACAPATPTREPAVASGGTFVQQLVDGARREGELSLVWSESTIGGTKAATVIADLVNKKYGLNLKLNFTPGPSMPDLAVRITQEVAAKTPATSDVYIGTEAQIKDMLAAKILAPLDYSALTPNAKQEMLAPDNVAVEVAVRVPGITYNTRLVAPDKLPQTADDLLKPEWKGKIASTTYATFFDVLGSPQIWGPTRTVNFAEKLSANVGGLIRCGETERLVSGEFVMLVFDCGSYEARGWQSRGAPIGHTTLSDAAALLYWYLGVPQNSAHPNAAALWISEALSREGQDVIWDNQKTDHPKIAGSHAIQEIQDAEAKGRKFAEANVQFMLSYPEQAKVRSSSQAALQKSH